MPEEATTADLVELTCLAFEAANRRDLDAVISFFASRTVFEGRMADTYEGRVALRSFLEDWFGAYEELEFKLEDVRDLGSGVVFAVVVQEGVPAGSAGHDRVWQREGWVFLWERGLIARLATLYSDIDEGRAAAGALAESRG
jgi:ketosteroid isomerase-like protein